MSIKLQRNLHVSTVILPLLYSLDTRKPTQASKDIVALSILVKVSRYPVTQVISFRTDIRYIAERRFIFFISIEL